MGFVANKVDWVKYADVVGDHNPIHRNDNIARASGLAGVVAPGMWIASHVQGEGAVQRASFRFKNLVYNGNSVRRDANSFYVEDKLACKGEIILGTPTNNNVFLPSEDIVYAKDFCASPSDIGVFLDSIGLSGVSANPEMYLMSLSASALLGYAEKKGLVGIHASQSMEVHKPYDLEDVKVCIEEEKIGGRMCKLNLYWKSDRKCVASGKAMVLPVSI